MSTWNRWTGERALKGTMWACLLLGVLGLAVTGFAFFELPRDQEPSPDAQQRAPDWPEPAQVAPAHWSVFHAVDKTAAVASDPLSERFRLAGTFVAFGMPSDSGRVARRAIIDDLKKKTQVLLQEESTLDEFDVVRIQEDSLVLGDRGREYILKLSFSGDVTPEAPASSPEAPTAVEEEVLEVTRFGKRVGERRWVLKRGELQAYYEQLLDDPERLAALYLSMKPDYVEGVIGGYRLNMEGEEEFFGQMGLQEGDVIRKVNSMMMVSQNRAEYFIREFIKDRLGAIVFDIERNGEPDKLIYLIR